MKNTDCLVEVIRAISELNLPYMVVGAYSSNAYGLSRSTNDADIVIQYREGCLRELSKLVGSHFVVDPQMALEVRTGSVRNVLRYRPTDFEIELFRLTDDPHDQTRFERRRKVLLPALGVEVVLPTAEDVVVQKLRWQRDKDLADVRVVLEIQKDRLDWNYIRHWTDCHQTTHLLDKLLKDLSS